MDNPSLVSGDFVRLVLGGPVMLVKSLVVAPEHPSEAICQWFSDSSELQQGEFRLEHLVVVPAPKIARKLSEKRKK